MLFGNLFSLFRRFGSVTGLTNRIRPEWRLARFFAVVGGVARAGARGRSSSGCAGPAPALASDEQTPTTCSSLQGSLAVGYHGLGDAHVYCTPATQLEAHCMGSSCHYQQRGHSLRFGQYGVGLWQQLELRSPLEVYGTAGGGGRFLGTP